MKHNVIVILALFVLVALVVAITVAITTTGREKEFAALDGTEKEETSLVRTESGKTTSKTENKSAAERLSNKETVGLIKGNIMGKKNLGSLLALYPKPMTVIGAQVEGRVNWLVVGHTGIIGHDCIVVSMNKNHYTNKGIRKSGKLSINLVSEAMLDKADYVGSVSGEKVDKSKVFAYHMGANGTPVIDEAPVTMECKVEDVYETEGSESIVCSIVNTYASGDVLDDDDKLDYSKLKPVLFNFPTYTYLATGEIIGKCLNLDKQPRMCAKEPMQADGIVRLSRVEVKAEHLDEYMKFASEVGEVSLRTEPGVLTMYAMSEKENPCIVTILETYASGDAYKKHIASAHFQKYKQGTLLMVKSLVLSDQNVLNPANTIKNYMK